MSTLTIRLPDDKHKRLKALARSNSISINKLMDELVDIGAAPGTLKRSLFAAWPCWQGRRALLPCAGC